MNQEIKISPAGEKLEIYTGTALTPREPLRIFLDGDIDAVSAFLKRRVNKILFAPTPEGNVTAGPGEAMPTKLLTDNGLQKVDEARAVVIVDKEKNTIELRLDPENFFGAIVKGTLEESKELGLFCINEEKEFTREELIKLFRFNKIHFANADKADVLIQSLQKFSGNAYVELAKEDDTRGNSNVSVQKRVRTGIPETFQLELPIYKGQPKEKVDVAICLDIVNTRVAFWFESVELAELLEKRKDEIFAKQLECCDSFPIINK